MIHHDLVEQAKLLAGLERGRPKLVSLRRAVSSLYYALFHYLIHHSTCLLMGSQASESSFRNILARGYDHRSLREACDSFRRSKILKDRFKDLDPAGYAVPDEIQDIAAVFSVLQEMRHLADYNLNRKWSRGEILAMIDQTERSIQVFDQLKLKDPHRSFFLGNLIAWSKH